MLKPGAVIERYVVEDVLGQGGTAVVYRVRHRKLGTEHALKVLTWMGAQAEVRLLLEGRVQAGLRHPNVVAVTDVLDLESGPGLLMEYIPPPTLSGWLDDHEPSHAEIERIFRAIVAGVNHAHKHGLVHRDLKPSNVLMQPSEGLLVPKVADFGLAKLLSDDPAAQNTRSGLTMGTPQYMAPEQFRDAKTVDRRADLFSLGCILYELVAGFPPFEWSDFIQLYNTILARGYRPLPNGTPAAIVAAVDGCLDPDRDTRVGDCGVLLSILDGRPRPSVPTLIPGDAMQLLPRVPDAAAPASRRRPVPAGPEPTLASGPVHTAIPGGGDTEVPVGGGTLDPGSASPSGGITWSDASATMQGPAAALAAVPHAAPPAPVRPRVAPPAEGRPKIWNPTDSATTMLPESSFGQPQGAAAPTPFPVPTPYRVPVFGRFGSVGVGALATGVVVVAIVARVLLSAPEASSLAEPTTGSAADAVTEVPANGAVHSAPDPIVPVAVDDKVTVQPAVAASGRPPPTRPIVAVPGKPPAKVVVAEPGIVAPTATPTVAPPLTPPVVMPAALEAHASMAIVTIAGEAEAVLLVSESGRFPPGEVPPGHYLVLASFPGLAYAKAAEIDVVAGQHVKLTCTTTFAQCSRR